MRKFLVGLVAAAALFVAQPAQAYLHVVNAQNTCYQLHIYSDAWFAQNGYGVGWTWWLPDGNNARAYERISDSVVFVQCAFESYNGGSLIPVGRLEVVTKVVGSDASNGNAFGDGFPWWPYAGADPYPYGEWHNIWWNF